MEDLDLETEYARISEHEEIYIGKVNLWHKIETVASNLIWILFFLTLASVVFFPSPIKIPDILQTHPSQVFLFLIACCSFVLSIIITSFSSKKIFQIQNELGLEKEEQLYLRTYETYKYINSYLLESKRKPYFRKLALENAEKMTKIVRGWEYGNIDLIRNLIGNQIDLLKDNMKRLILSNIAKGDESRLIKVSHILFEFCKYIRSPSIKKLNELNSVISELPFTEYKVLTTEQRMISYFIRKPRFARLLFALIIVIIVGVVGLCLSLSIGIIFAVAIASFWGAFTGFDKIFRLKEK